MGHPRVEIFRQVSAERARQDEMWGGPKHDDAHYREEWICYIERQARRAGDVAIEGEATYRDRLVRIAALAVAALESHDRHAASLAASLSTPD